jgi:hypothetical protein
MLADDAGTAFVADLFVRDEVRAPFTPARSGARKHKILADAAELVLPERLGVEDVGCVDLRRDSAGKVFDGFSCLAARNRGIVAMGLGVGFLEETDPSFILIAALGEVQGFGATLEEFLVLILLVGSADSILSQDDISTFIVCRSSEVQLVVDNAVVPFSVSMEDEAVDADSLVLNDADAVNELLVAAESGNGSEEPAVSG